jgi:hypothetical protein
MDPAKRKKEMKGKEIERWQWKEKKRAETGGRKTARGKKRRRKVTGKGERYRKNKEELCKGEKGKPDEMMGWRWKGEEKRKRKHRYKDKACTFSCTISLHYVTLETKSIVLISQLLVANYTNKGMCALHNGCSLIISCAHEGYSLQLSWNKWSRNVIHIGKESALLFGSTVFTD